MPLHHYLPAAFIASFSLDTSTSPRRSRQLYTGDKQEDRVFLTSAANVAAVKNLYTLVATEFDSEMVDNIWTEYERNLRKAIGLLIEGKLDAVTWIRTLVPFVACMLLRGPDFDRRFERRMNSLGLDEDGGLLSEDNTNLARLIELQRLLGPVAVAKWKVIRTSGAGHLITNDLGYAPFSNRLFGDAGIAIPLDLSHILAVIPRNEGVIAVVQSGEWVPDIEYAEGLHDDHEGLNRALSTISQRFIFGPDEETVKRWLLGSPEAPIPAEPEQLGFLSSRLARAHEFTWHRLATALERDPLETVPWDFPLDWEALSHGWVPPVMLPTNLMEFPPALHREGDSISAEFYDPEVYYALSLVRNYEEMSAYDSLAEEATRGLNLAQDNAQKVGFLVARAGANDELESHEEALRDYDEALGLDPQSVMAITNRGVTLLKLERFDAAARDFEKALVLDPDQGVARLNLGTIHYLRDEPDMAVREITRAIPSLPKGREQSAAHLSRGNAYLELNSYQEAIDDFAVAAELTADSEQKAHCEFRRAVALSGSGDNDAAFRAIVASLELNEESFEAHTLKGELSLERGELEDAVAELTRALELGASDTTTSQALNLRAEAYVRQSRLDLALLDLDRAAYLDPNSSEIHYNRGNVRLFTGAVDAAIEAFDRALELDSRNAGALINRGVAHSLHEAFTLAVEDYRGAISIFGDSEASGSAFRNLALCYAIWGDRPSSTASIRRARDLDARSPFNDQVEGLVRLYEGRFTDSLTLLSQFASDLDDRPEAKLYVSLPLALLDKLDEARTLAGECLRNLESPVTKMQYVVHVRALRNAFPEEANFAAFFRTVDPA